MQIIGTWNMSISYNSNTKDCLKNLHVVSWWIMLKIYALTHDMVNKAAEICVIFNQEKK